MSSTQSFLQTETKKAPPWKGVIDVSGSHSSCSRGSGLGLAICRALVEAHGGQIWVEEREGGGAVFHFTLPLNIREGIQL